MTPILHLQRTCPLSAFQPDTEDSPQKCSEQKNTMENTGDTLRHSQVVPVGLVTRPLRCWLQPDCTFWIFPAPVDDSQAGKEV